MSRDEAVARRAHTALANEMARCYYASLHGDNAAHWLALISVKPQEAEKIIDAMSSTISALGLTKQEAHAIN